MGVYTNPLTTNPFTSAGNLGDAYTFAASVVAGVFTLTVTAPDGAPQDAGGVALRITGLQLSDFGLSPGATLTSLDHTIDMRWFSTTGVGYTQIGTEPGWCYFLLDGAGNKIGGDRYLDIRGEVATHAVWTTFTAGNPIFSQFFDPTYAQPSGLQIALNVSQIINPGDTVTIQFRNLSFTANGSGGGGMEIELFESVSLTDSRGPIPLTLDLTETLPLIVVDPTTISNKPPGTGQPKRFSDGAFLDSCDPSDARATVCTRTTRAIPTALAAHLAGECLTIAYCVRVVRRDGTILGFTTHDADLTFDPGLGPVAFEALNSLSVTALRQELGATVGNMDLAGLIRSDRITAADLLAGRYDGAELTLYLVNWESLDDGFMILARGWWGSVTTIDARWDTEYRSVAQRLQQQIVEQTSPTCRVLQLGDARCKISLTPFQFSRVVNSVVDGRNFTFGADTHAANYYAAGRVIFVTGANEALQREVKRSTPAVGSVVIELQEAMPFPVAIGDLATLEAGCDRRFATCRDRFGNTDNFRGEPNVPGAQALRRIQSLVVVG